MLSDVFSVLSGKMANEKKLDTITNNLANALTPGFKCIEAAFSTSTVDDDVEEGQVPTGYVNIPDGYIRFSDAPLVNTGNPLDLGLEGSAFFAVSTQGGTMYTRNGQFMLDSTGRIVTHDGNAVQSQSGGDIAVPAGGKDIRIGGDGSVYVDKLFIDRVKVVDFQNKQDLKPVGGNLFANANSGNQELPAEHYVLHQGAYETSNVDIMKSMVQIITALRAYESYAKVDQSASDMLGKLIDLGKF
jgi:flagellar basal-body rod protein FlgG